MIPDTQEPVPKLIRFEKTSSEVWNQLWQGCSWATFFESELWYQTWIAAMAPKFSPTPFLAEFSDGTECIVPALAGFRAGGLLKNLEASPGGTYGGPLSLSRISLTHIELIAEALQRQGNFQWRVNPYILRRNVPFLGSSEITHTLDLSQKTDTLDSLFRKKRVLAYARKASESGFSVRLTDAGFIPDFLEVYASARERWSEVATSYPESIFNNLIKTGHCDFWGVFDSNNNFVGGGPILRSSRIVSAWLPLVHTKVLKHRIYELLYLHCIRYYKENGYQWFDFNPSGSLENVGQFKSKFSPEELASPFVSQTSSLYKLADQVSGIVRS